MCPWEDLIRPVFSEKHTGFKRKIFQFNTGTGGNFMRKVLFVIEAILDHEKTQKQLKI